MVIEWDVIKHQLEYQRILGLQSLNVPRHQWAFFAASGNNHHFQQPAQCGPSQSCGHNHSPGIFGGGLGEARGSARC